MVSIFRRLVQWVASIPAKSGNSATSTQKQTSAICFIFRLNDRPLAAAQVPRTTPKNVHAKQAHGPANDSRLLGIYWRRRGQIVLHQKTKKARKQGQSKWTQYIH
jgi:hypothetical protein